MNNLFFSNNNSRGKTPPPPKDKNFKRMQSNTINSLHEVEFFLNNFSYIMKCVKLFKFLK